MRTDFTAEEKLASLMGGRGFNGADAPQPAHGIPTLRPGDIHLGDTVANIPIGISLAKLIDGRLLIQGNSGAGKSMLLRRLFEQAFGRVQQLLIDSDGEFSTLAENFDVAVLAAVDVSRVGPRKFALHLREHRYSAVLDLSDATSEQRLDIVADVAAGLIDAAEAHWHPLLVLVDEAQTFAPHYDTGDVEAETRKRAIAALADLMGRGRKRGIAGVIATQRLAETSKAVVSKATNIIAGRTIFDRDLERAGALLGFTVGQSRPLRTLADGEFLCLGPAIAGPKRVRFRAGPVKSRHKGRAPTLVAPPAISAAAAGELLKKMPDVAAPIPAAVGHTPARRGFRARDWRLEEDAIIRAGYAVGELIPQIGARLAAIGFSTSTSNISMRAHALGLVSARAAVQWSDREDEILRDAYLREVRIIDICDVLAKEGFTRGRVAIQMRAIALGITRDRVNYWKVPEKEIALRGLEGGKPYREIIADLKAAGYERGITGLHKLAQKNNFNRAMPGWTAEETAELKRLYDLKTPVPKIEKALGKTRGAIATMASKLGLRQREAWTDAEKGVLRKAQRSGVRLVDCQALLPGRTYATIARMTGLLRLDFSQNRKVTKQRRAA